MIRHVCSAAGVFFITLSASAASFAQENARPPIASAGIPSAASCKADLGKWYDAAYKAASDSTEKKLIARIDFESIRSKSTDYLRECVLRINAAPLKGDELLTLARTYAEAGEHAPAMSATTRYLKEAPSDSIRAAALIAMIRTYQLPNYERLQRAEPYADLLDKLPASVNKVKLLAHDGLFRDYQVIDIDLGIARHTRAMIDIARSMKAFLRTDATPDVPSDKVDASMVLAIYLYAALVDGNFGRENEALNLLQQARRDHPEIESKYYDGMYGMAEKRLRLVGKPALDLSPGFWLNATADIKTATLAGNVSVIGFTAHWCPPCHATYTPLQAMADSLAGKGVRFYFATEYFGYVGSKRNLSVEQEREASREYYERRKIRFPVGMFGQGVAPGSTEPRKLSPEFDFYSVQQIPLAIIVDRKGIVRRAIVGWDPSNSERLPALIASLLNEK